MCLSSVYQNNIIPQEQKINAIGRAAECRKSDSGHLCLLKSYYLTKQRIHLYYRKGQRCPASDLRPSAARPIELIFCSCGIVLF